MACWTHIAHNSFSAPASSLTWTSIPTDGTYDHLLILASVRSNRAADHDSIRIGFNDRDTAGDYSTTSILSYGTSGSAVRTANNTAQAPKFLGDITGGNSTANCFGLVKIWVPDYARSNRMHSAVCQVTREDTDSFSIEQSHLLFEYAEAIDEIYMGLNGGSFISGSEFTLIGVKGA